MARKKMRKETIAELVKRAESLYDEPEDLEAFGQEVARALFGEEAVYVGFLLDERGWGYFLHPKKGAAALSPTGEIFQSKDWGPRIAKDRLPASLERLGYSFVDALMLARRISYEDAIRIFRAMAEGNRNLALDIVAQYHNRQGGAK